MGYVFIDGVKMIIFWGPNNAGRKTYITTLYNTIQTKCKTWKMTPTSEFSRELIAGWSIDLFNNKKIPYFTDTVKDDEKYYFDIEYIPFPPTQIKKKSIQLLYLDPNGAFFENPDKEIAFKKLITENFKQSSGVLLLIDPERKETSTKDSYYALFSRHISKLMNIYYQDSVHFNKIQIPFAICFTKMELEKHKQYIKFPQKFATHIIGQDTCELIDNYVQLYKYFTCSSVGFENNDSNTYCDACGYTKLHKEPDPICILEPLKWITINSYKVQKENNETIRSA